MSSPDSKSQSFSVHHGIAVTPPSPSEIQKIRIGVGSQQFCADLIGISKRTWERYEYIGSDAAYQRKPSEHLWGLFLLAIGQHPKYTIIARKANTEIEAE